MSIASILHSFKVTHFINQTPTYFWEKLCKIFYTMVFPRFWPFIFWPFSFYFNFLYTPPPPKANFNHKVEWLSYTIWIPHLYMSLTYQSLVYYVSFTYFVYLISMLLKFVYQNFHHCFRDRTNSNHNGRLITNTGYLSYHKMALDQRPVHQMD